MGNTFKCPNCTSQKTPNTQKELKAPRVIAGVPSTIFWEGDSITQEIQKQERRQRIDRIRESLKARIMEVEAVGS